MILWGHKDAKMLNISNTGKYGLRGLLYLLKNQGQGFIKIDRIAREENIPENYLRKIFQRLIKHHIVESGVGPGGGVKISREADGMSIAHAIEVIDGKPPFGGCTLFGYPKCPQLPQCPIHNDCDEVTRQMWDALTRTKITDLVLQTVDPLADL